MRLRRRGGSRRVEWRVVTRWTWLLACLLLVGCLPGPEPSPLATPTQQATTAPAGTVSLRDLGFEHAPADLLVPRDAEIEHAVDQVNAVVVAFSAPDGATLARFFRSVLPQQGWVITADGNDSLLFERDGAHGAFTVTGDTSALTVRYDEKS